MMGKKVLAAKSGKAACSCAAAGGGVCSVGVFNAEKQSSREAKSFLTGLTGFTGLREASVKPAKTKPCGVEWVGDIPEGWEVRRLKYVASCNDDSLAEDTPSNFSFDYVDVGSVKYGLGIVQREPMVFADAPSRARRVVRKDDVIVSTVRTYLKSVAQIPSFNKPIIVSTGFAVLRAKNSDVIFLNYALQSQSFVDEVEARSTGISYPAINASDLVSIKILLPPLPVQRAIAAYLDEKCGAIDAAVAETKKGIEEYKAWKKSLIFEVVTGKRRVGFFNAESKCARDEVVGLPERSEPEGLQGAASRRVAESFSTGLTRFTGLGENLVNPVNPVKTKPSGIPWIGDVPVGWEVKRLKYIASCNDDSLTEDTPLDFSFDYVDVGSVKYGLGIVQREPMLFAHAPSRARRVVRKDDVIVSTVRTYLKSVSQIPQFNKPLIVSTGFAVLRAKNADTIFLSYALQSQSFVDEVEARSTGISYPAINASDLVGIKLPLPLLSEQKAIAAYLDDKCAAIDKMVAEKNALIADLEAYKKSLIFEVVTGKREVK